MRSGRVRTLLKDPAAALAGERSQSPTWAKWIERTALPVVWVGLIVGYSIALPSTFPTVGNISATLGSQVITLLLALALMIPLLAGDYDLSVSYNAALCAMVISVLNVRQGWPWYAAAVLVLFIGVLIGLVNAAVTLWFGIDSLIVTLGVGTLLSGVELLISGSAIVSGVSGQLVAVITNRVLGVPLEFWYGAVICILLWYFLSFTPAGRRLLFVGRSRTVSRLSGIKVGRVRLLSFVAAGTISAICGIVFAGTLNGATPSSGPTYLLPAFAAVFLGATTIVPGRFNPWGAFVAVYFLGTGITGLELLGLASWIQPIFYGGALLIAVALSQLARGRQPLQTAS